MIDYAQTHEPVSDLFTPPATPADWEALALSQEQIDQFDRDGFLLGVDVFTQEQVERLRADLAELAGPNPPGRDLFYEYHSNESENADTCIFHALGAWRTTPLFHDVLWAPPMVMASHQLLGGGPIRLMHDQLFCKPASDGGVVAWHQDYSYWTWTEPMAHLTCWIGLDDVDEENGCLWYVPGSHKWPDLPITGLTGGMDAVRDVLNEEQIAEFENRVPVRMKAGQATFHHPRTMHGSYENRSDRPRRATIVNTMRDGVRSAIRNDKRDMQTQYLAPPDGELMGGPGYPMLFNPTEAGVTHVPVSSL